MTADRRSFIRTAVMVEGEAHSTQGGNPWKEWGKEEKKLSLGIAPGEGVGIPLQKISRVNH